MEIEKYNLKYNSDGLIPAIAQDAQNGDVLMMAWMNSDAIQKTLETKKVTYWSRSRKALWVKGETSGHVQELVDFRIDCDRDCILVLINQTGSACHTNRRSCFYTSILDGTEQELLQPEA